jgi:hypothetical protein
MKTDSEYLVRLTDQIIQQGGYVYLRRSIYANDAEGFRGHIKDDMFLTPVKDMNPQTLGKIMGSFGPYQVLASHDELFAKVRFMGDCENVLRELVAACLSYFIRDRFNPERAQYVPQYTKEK